MSALSVATRGYFPSATAQSVSTRGYFASVVADAVEKTYGGKGPHWRDELRRKHLLEQALREDEEMLTLFSVFVRMRQ